MSRGWVGTAALWISLGVACSCGGASGPNGQQNETVPAPIVKPIARR